MVHQRQISGVEQGKDSINFSHWDLVFIACGQMGSWLSGLIIAGLHLTNQEKLFGNTETESVSTTWTF